MLSDRRRRILRALVEEYVACALPVGSRTLTERYALGVSPATVRSDLSALEEAGYISQPHTSAGRIPTDAGYRAFVDDLLADNQTADSALDSDALSELKACAAELDELAMRTSSALSRMTDCLSVVLAPTLLSSRLRQISLVSLSDHTALIVLVSEDGQVANRPVTLPRETSAVQLAALQQKLNELFNGLSCADIPHKTPFVEADSTDELLRFFIEEILICAKENAPIHPQKDGINALLRKPEFSTADSLLGVMTLLEDDAVLFRVLDPDLCQANECMVRIGHENPLDELSRVSVVAGRYGQGEGAGIVAVIGPTRMDYRRVMGAVAAARAILNDS